MFYFDTSILAPYYCPEPLSELAEQKSIDTGGNKISIISKD